jgi:ADP-ribose pyrophosphatase
MVKQATRKVASERNVEKSATRKTSGGRAGRAHTSGKKSGPRGVELLSSKLSYSGPLFQVFTDRIRENGRELRRDVIRHGGSAVILALDDSESKTDPLVILERQYRHATDGYLLEVPAGKLEPGENQLSGAKRELLEETGYRARHWSRLVRYFASPGFLGEWMQVFLAEGLESGDAAPEYDEQIEIQKIPLSEVLRMIEDGKIHDGKTLIAILLYSRLHQSKGGSRRNKK